MFGWLLKRIWRQKQLPAAPVVPELPPPREEKPALPKTVEVGAVQIQLPPAETHLAEVHLAETQAAIEPVVEAKAIELGPIEAAPIELPPITIEAARLPETIEPESTVAPPEAKHEPTVSHEPAAVSLVAAKPLRFDEDYQRSRSLYFTPARYEPGGSGFPALMAPDLAFRAHQRSQRLPKLVSAPETPVAPEAPAEPRPMPPSALERFITSTGSLSPAEPGLVTSLDPVLFSAFALWPEAHLEVPPQATRAYLEEPTLAGLGRELRDLVLRNWSDGGAPLTPPGYAALSSSIVNHAGTAMLLCHNVAKAFARGGVAIEWRKVNRPGGEYSDGVRDYSAFTIHRQGLVRPTALSNPSIFYLLFSARPLGTGDPGDWYRYFAISTLATYTLHSATVRSVHIESGQAFDWANRLDRIAGMIGDSTLESNTGYKAWLWANAISFGEWGFWGRTQARASEASRLALHAARFAFANAQSPIAGRWPWFVPKAGTLAHESPGADSIHETLSGEDRAV